MDIEPTTLSDVVRLIEEVLHEHYGIDPKPLLAAAGVPEDRAEVSGSRISRDAVMRLWDLAAAKTGDASVGLVVGSKVRATTFYALGVAFLTCETLAQSLELLCRYYRVIVTVPLQLDLAEDGDRTVLNISYTSRDYPLLPIPYDSFIASIVGLCRMAASPDLNPVEVRMACENNGREGDYQAVFHAPVVFSAAGNALVFSSEELARPLPGRSADILVATDRILENYLGSLGHDDVASEVRRLLIQSLPTGNFGQDAIARRMHMSRSTLHRRLRNENTNFKELMESTRSTLAIEYVKDPQHSLSYITFVLGFADQSNFSRAFRRWTGQSPKAYRESMVTGAG